MTLLVIIIFWVLVCGAGALGYFSDEIQLSYSKRKQLKSAPKQLSAVQDTIPDDYDPHYTRAIEVEQDIKGVLTQCDDKKCAVCYWKIRALSKHGFPTVELNTKFKAFISELPDGLSDELYDSMLATWTLELAVEIEQAKKDLAAQKLQHQEDMRIYRKNKEDRQMEVAYATPMRLIEQYKAEGRTYNKHTNSWSAPGGLSDRAKQLVKEIDKAKKNLEDQSQYPKLVQQGIMSADQVRANTSYVTRKREYEARRHDKVYYDFDVKTNQHYKIVMRGEFFDDNGQLTRSMSKYPITEEEFYAAQRNQ